MPERSEYRRDSSLRVAGPTVPPISASRVGTSSLDPRSTRLELPQIGRVPDDPRRRTRAPSGASSRAESIPPRRGPRAKDPAPQRDPEGDPCRRRRSGGHRSPRDRHRSIHVGRKARVPCGCRSFHWQNAQESVVLHERSIKGWVFLVNLRASGFRHSRSLYPSSHRCG